MSDRYVCGRGLLWRRVGDEVLIRALDGRIATLKGTGGALWAELAAPVTADELVRRLGSRYPGSADRVATDVRATLDALVEDGLVECR